MTSSNSVQEVSGVSELKVRLSKESVREIENVAINIKIHLWCSKIVKTREFKSSGY